MHNQVTSSLLDDELYSYIRNSIIIASEWRSCW